MFNVVLLSLFITLVLSDSSRLWPSPQEVTFGDYTVRLDSNFQFDSSSYNDILAGALERYHNFIKFYSVDTVDDKAPMATVSTVHVKPGDLNAPLEYGMDESYTIKVYTSSVFITSNTIWGCLRALETFSQLVESSPSHGLLIRSCPITVTDSPRWSWRGLLIDTARHYLPVRSIKKVIDSMSYVKMSVLHWHLVDAQSFPLVLPSQPDLAGKGAFRKDLVYDPATVKEIIAYAKTRGIMVIPEIDVPGHAYSWGFSDPDLIAKCPSRFQSNVNNYPLNPSNPKTFSVLKNIAKDMKSLFNVTWLHLGADEPNFKCWEEDPDVAKWMKEEGLKGGADVYRFFWEQALPIFSEYRTILWQEAVLLGANPPKTSLIHVWEGLANVKKIVSQGYDILTSAGFYLDRQQPTDKERYGFIDTWRDMFEVEPLTGLTETEQKRLKGGEAAMWGESVDAFSIESRIWPRALAVAERLWFELKGDIDWKYEANRLERHRCRMVGRGVIAGPIVPGPPICKFSVKPYVV
ncbi:hypothetical protein GEMRC1_002461 [Eukaryota sp. GEM-RC1]